MYNSDDAAVIDSPLIEERNTVKWENDDNNAFYESIKAEGLQKFAEKGGLASGCDMHVLTAYWTNARTILEVGAGYGRAIDYLLKHQFQGNITAIERCNALFEHLTRKFNPYKNVYLLHEDIRFLSDINYKFDLILMLWSSIADFAPQEQKLIFIKLAKLLNKNGKLIIDTLPPSSIPLGMTEDGQRVYTQELNGSVIHTYSMLNEEINKYAYLAGFTSITHTTYYTDNRRERLLHILV